MPRRGAFTSALLLWSASTLTGAPQTTPERVLHSVFNADPAPRIDGVLDEDCWLHADTADGFLQREPHEGEAATLVTVVKIFHSATHLYVGARLDDPEPTRIVATEYRRDSELDSNDFFEIFLDTFHDRQNAFYFATNAVGAQRDALVRAEGEAVNWEWDGLWTVACGQDDRGWTVEMAIPFSTLRFPAALVDGWGINFGRYVARLREDSYWAPIDAGWGFNAKWRVSAFGRLGGVTGVKRAGRVQLKPFVLGGLELDREDGDGSTEVPVDAGLDAKLAIGSTLAADLTLNTDFAQVEADVEQVNLTRFPLFYPEKREFFLENAGLFQFGERARPFETPSSMLFFSRQIGLTEDGDVVPILGGARLTGKLGSFDIGALDIVTRETIIDEETRVPQTNFAAVRVKRQIMSRSSIGGIFLSKRPGEEAASNDVIGADANFAFDNNLTLGGYLAKSYTAGLTGSRHAAAADAGWTGDRGSIYAQYADIGDDFESEMGFLQRTGVRKYRLSAFISPRLNGRAGIRQLFAGNDHNYFTKRDGTMESEYNFLWSYMAFESAGGLFVAWSNSAENLDEPFEIRDEVEVPPGSYRFDTFSAEFESNRSRPISGHVSASTGGFYGGTLHSFSGSSRLKQGRLSAELSYSQNNVDIPIAGGRFTTRLAIARGSYAFSPRAYISALGQVNTDDDETRAYVLFRYTYRPGADLFVVYNEECRINGNDPGLKRRQFLIKATYYFSPR